MGENVDLTKIKIFGKCIDQDGKKTQTGKKSLIKFKSIAPNGRPSAGELKVNMDFVVEGKGYKPEMLWSTVVDPEDDPLTAVAYFVPVKAGPHRITMKYAGRKLTPQPLVIESVGADIDIQKALSKVELHGRAWELGKAYSHNEFVVDCSNVQPPLGNLKVHVKGPPRSSAQLQIVDNDNGTYKINYKPTQPGMYSMNIKIADTDIPGSPFQIRVTEFLSS